MPDFIPAFPDWASPQPTDGPTLEETEAVRHIQAAGADVSRQIVEIYAYGATADRWTALGDRLQHLATMCRNIAANKKRTVELPPAGHEPDHDNQI